MKEHLWGIHFSEYGRGVCMYRTNKTRELVSKVSYLIYIFFKYSFMLIIFQFVKLIKQKLIINRHKTVCLMQKLCVYEYFKYFKTDLNMPLKRTNIK